MSLSTRSQIVSRMTEQAPFGIWTPVDFVDLCSLGAVDQALSRMVATEEIRRITRGLYDLPRLNTLTMKQTNPNPSRVIDALVRRDQARMLVDGLTAANDLGLSNAVPSKIIVHTDARLRPITLGAQIISFKLTAPGRLYWAGRPGMRLIQALHWLRDKITIDKEQIKRRVRAILRDEKYGAAIANDIKNDLTKLPNWMQSFLIPIINGENTGLHGTTCPAKAALSA